MLMHRGAFGWKHETWQLAIQLWLILFTVAGVASVIGAFASRKMLRAMWFSRMICPGCGAIYRQPVLLGFNCGMSRYERCSACHKWHWVTLKNVALLKDKQTADGS
jgi:formate dehydrogenase maturation protein FdhE